MNTHVIAIPIIAALSMAFYSHDGNQSVAHKRHSKSALFPGAYDRIGPEEQPVRVQRCKTYGTVWRNGACWRPERIPRT